jgi:hypothetical protein
MESEEQSFERSGAGDSAISIPEDRMSTARKHMYLAGQSAGTFATLVCTLGIASCGGAMSSAAAPRSRERFSGIHGRFLSGYKQGYKSAKNRVKNARPDGLLRGLRPSSSASLRTAAATPRRPTWPSASFRTGLFSVGGSNCLFPIGWHRMSNTSLEALRARTDSNRRPPGSKPGALSS